MTGSVSEVFSIARIPFSNTTPYAIGGAPAGCCFVPMAPRDSVGALRDGRVGAALAPVGALPTLRDVVEDLGPYGIAADAQTRSVLLFADRPLADFGPTSRVRLTTASSTSVRLLFLLFGYRLGFGRLPARARAGEPAAAELLIGDEALLRYVKAVDGQDSATHVIDLATEWFEVHAMPFVFARWVVRRDAAAAVKDRLREWLEDGSRHDRQRVAAAAREDSPRLGLSVAVVEDYLLGLRRALTTADFAGQARFESELAAHPEIEEALRE